MFATGRFWHKASPQPNFVMQHAVEHYPGAVTSQSSAVTEQSFQSAAEEQVARFRQIYQQAVANHITVISASGD